jgi:hypothetical protein
MSDDNFYFTKVTALPDGEALVCGHLAREQDEPTFTRLYLVSSHGWRHVADMPDIVYSMARGKVDQGSRPDLFVLGRDGAYKFFSTGLPPINGHVPKKDVTYLEAAATFFGVTYVCGGQNQVFRLLGDAWDDISKEIYEPFEGRLTASLEAMASLSSGEVLFVGDRGSVLCYRNGVWRRIDVPTNVNLLCATSASSRYLVGGANGVLLEISAGDRVRDLANDVTADTRIAAFAEYRERVYAACTDKLILLSGSDEPVEVPTPNDFGLNSIASVDAVGDHLWITGGEQVLRFDGSVWEVFLSPDNH